MCAGRKWAASCFLGKIKMSDLLIKPHDDLRVITRRDNYDQNDGSIIALRNKTDENCGRAYCIAKAPRFATDEEWQDTADLIIKALKTIL